MSQITREQMLQVFENRCSTRYYDPNKKISQEDFAAILEFARLSPSSVGSEPWKFLVIQNKALRDKLKPFSWGMQYQLDDCSHLVIILAKKNARYDTPFFRDVAERRGLQGEQLEKALAKYKGLQEVEMKTAESERALFDWTSKQTYIALANMLTGAAAIGVDSCPIEGFNYDKMNGAYLWQQHLVIVLETLPKNLVDQLKKSLLGLNNLFSNKWAANAALFFTHQTRLRHLLLPPSCHITSLVQKRSLLRPQCI